MGRAVRWLLAIGLVACHRAPYTGGARLPNGEPRFQRIEELAAQGDDKNLVHAAAGARGPAYPGNARARNEPGYAVVSFVIDTTGRVEMPTASLVALQGDWGFFGAVCSYLKGARYDFTAKPQRVIATQPFNFSVQFTPVPTMSPSDMRTIAQLESMPTADLVKTLEHKPHCP